MIELNPEEVHVSLYDTAKTGSWDTNNYMKGVTVIHLPTGTKVSVGSNKSVHKNKHQTMIILQDLLTPFKQSDVVYDGENFKEIKHIRHAYEVVAFERGGAPLSDISHTKEGYNYKKVKVLKESLAVLEVNYYNDRDIILEEIKQLEGGV